MTPLILVMLGGALGAGARFGVGRLVGAGEGAWPWATLAVNVAGGFLMGLLAAAVARGWAGEGHRLALGTGVLGGFTTFSAFSLELAGMFEAGRAVAAAGYALVSVAAALAAVIAGQALGRAL